MGNRYDVAIIGSGFAGSILGWILAMQGRRVALIDKAVHPRFAIGESSTPIADLLLRKLGEEYSIRELADLSTYGSWQASHPEIACGRKRGFSYYFHRQGNDYCDGANHERSLMVAASASDENADTHWYRADVDQFLFERAIRAGCIPMQGETVSGIKLGERNTLQLHNGETINTAWIIDATGRAVVTENLLGLTSLDGRLKTRTSSVFGHFSGVRSWRQLCQQNGVTVTGDPFHTDDAAQHHLFENGWLWMLRFNNGITSVGWTSTNQSLAPPLFLGGPSNDRPPLIGEMFAGSKILNGPIHSGRIQRLFDPVISERCIMLPTTACAIDPLHSTGIAHAIGGIQRLANIILAGKQNVRQKIESYRESLFSEANLLDLLVHTAYQTMHDFKRFTTACMLYFCAAIACEEKILAGDDPDCLWSADDAQFAAMAKECCRKLRDKSRPTNRVTDEIRTAIAPWNTAGLMNPEVNNRYAYTATK